MAAEQPAVERERVNRSPLLRAAGMVGMIVRIVPSEGELHRGVLLEESNHRTGVLQERLNACCIEVVSGFVLNIGPGLLDRIIDPFAGCQRISRYPQPSARASSGAAELRGLFDKEH